MSDGVVFAYGACIGCHRMFWFNPFRVPSCIVDGTREPVCRECVARANPRRIANGLPPIVPLPGAYEPADESEWIDE
jgi:Fe-S-cluster-containing dehydrogenase component